MWYNIYKVSEKSISFEKEALSACAIGSAKEPGLCEHPLSELCGIANVSIRRLFNILKLFNYSKTRNIDFRNSYFLKPNANIFLNLKNHTNDVFLGFWLLSKRKIYFRALLKAYLFAQIVQRNKKSREGKDDKTTSQRALRIPGGLCVEHLSGFSRFLKLFSIAVNSDTSKQNLAVINYRG